MLIIFISCKSDFFFSQSFSNARFKVKFSDKAVASGNSEKFFFYLSVLKAGLFFFILLFCSHGEREKEMGLAVVQQLQTCAPAKEKQ